MLTKLRFGTSSELQLDVSPEALVAYCNAPRGEPIADVHLSTLVALRSPLDFPPLTQAALPGDKVAITIDHAVPQNAAIVAAVVEELISAGVSAGDIHIVEPCSEADQPDPRSLLSDEWRSEVQRSFHDPHNRDQLCYVAAGANAKPIYMNRTICEADLVIPISLARVDASLGYMGPASGLFPLYSDEQTARRYRAPRLLDSAERREKLRSRVDEASWLLGVPFSVVVVPGEGDHLLHVVAGRSGIVFARSQELCEAAWSFQVPRRASVVVAAVTGANGFQSWENTARALLAATQAVKEDGAIALCTDLAAKMGPATQQLCNAEDLERVLSEISKERPTDALVAAELAHALSRGPVYLLSQLDEQLVEDLGVASVRSAEELARLVARHESCILLANAQYAMATVEK